MEKQNLSKVEKNYLTEKKQGRKYTFLFILCKIETKGYVNIFFVLEWKLSWTQSITVTGAKF